MLYSGLPALHDLSSGSYQWAFSHGLHLLATCPLWMPPIYLLGIVTFFILYTSLSVRGDYLLCNMACYLRPILPTVCPQVSVTLYAAIRFTCLHLHKVPEGLRPYTLRTGPCQMDGRDIYGLIRCVPLTVGFGVGTPQPRWPVMMSRSNAGAEGGSYLFPSKLVRVKVG